MWLLSFSHLRLSHAVPYVCFLELLCPVPLCPVRLFSCQHSLVRYQHSVLLILKICLLQVYGPSTASLFSIAAAGELAVEELNRQGHFDQYLPRRERWRAPVLTQGRGTIKLFSG